MFLSLEVLPYLLTALIAAIVVPGFLYHRFAERGQGLRQTSMGWTLPNWPGKATWKDRPRCGANNRQGRSCAVRVEPGKRRCRFHGGLSTDIRTAEGKARIAAAQRRRWALHRQRSALEMPTVDLATEMPQMQFGSTITNYKSAQLVTLKVPKGITTVCGISGHCYSARGGVIRVPEQDAASLLSHGFRRITV